MRQGAVLAAILVLSACVDDKATEERAREEQVELTAGQAIDCAAELNEAARAVCGDTDLRTLDRRVAELWAQVSEVTGRPTTLARQHAEWLRSRDAGATDWDTGETRTRTPDELRDHYQGYIQSLEEELRLAQAIPATTPVSALAGGCIGTALNGCQAPAAGYVTGPNGERLAWQIQEGSTDFAGVSAGILLFAVDGESMTPVGWSFDGVAFEAPVMFADGGATFVAASGHQAGTGSANADVLYRLGEGRWTEIELESWKGALDQALPEGLGVWKGVNYNWSELVAFSSLWRDDDANCCPTGGEVVAELGISGTSLTLGTVNVNEARPAN